MKWLSKTMLASTVAFSLVAPAAYSASASDSPASALSTTPVAKNLTAETAKSFLDSFFASEHAKPLYVGASVIIVKDGKTIAESGYGYADLASKEPVDPGSSLFRIASVSKSFTATALMQLVEQGKVSLQDDFSKYIKGLKFDNPYDAPVTIEQLLTHTTGFEIQDPLPQDIHTDYDRVVKLDDYAREHMPPVVREPGSSYMYDNFASLLQGLVVQNVSGIPFETYMEENLFEPLEMTNSTFLPQEDSREQMVTEYGADGKELDYYAIDPTVMPHGGMLSTARDVGKYMVTFLNEGAAGSGRILKDSTVADMTEYRSYAHPLLPDTTYGFEAPIQLPGAGSSENVITKAGDLVGTSSLMFMIPEEETGVFLTYNKLGPLRDLFYPAFIAEFFPDIAKPANLDPAFEPYTTDELEVFSGVYSDLRLRAIVSTLGAEDVGSLVVSDAFLGPRSLKQVDHNLFVDGLTGKFTAFRLNEDGVAYYMKEPNLNPLGYARKGLEPAGYSDIPADHPYADSIHALQSLGYLPNDGKSLFGVEEAATRGGFVQGLMEISGLSGSTSTEPAFKDLAGHPSAPFIQQAYEMGFVKGANSDEFRPDRPITRQEAAVMIWRAYALLFPAELFQSFKLTGNTDEWAVPAVKMIVGLGLAGPEVKQNSDGSFDFLSKSQLKRQEEAYLLHALLTVPLQANVAKLMAAQQAQ